MPRSWFTSALAALSLAAPGVGAAQAPGNRLIYRLEIVQARPDGRLTLAAGEVSGPVETGLRFSLRSDTLEVEALVGVLAGSDSATLTAEFFTKRRLATSRRGLPLWEQDGYTKFAALAWGDTVRIYPVGPPRAGAADSLWMDVEIVRELAGGETRPGETIRLATPPGLAITVEAVVRPRRAVVVLNLVRGEAVTGPRRYDLVPGGAARRVDFMLAGRGRRTLEVSLARPEPPPGARDRALALDADVVCLRVIEPGGGGEPGAAPEPAGTLCGRLNNVARRLPLAGGDTLVAMFAWPGYR